MGWRSGKPDFRRPGDRPGPPERPHPMPIGDKCNPLCPLFKCTRNALFVVAKQYRGRATKVALCRLTGGECIGGECQYASCKISALLPDGKCAKAFEKKAKPLTEEELLKEIRSVEDVDEELLK